MRFITADAGNSGLYFGDSGRFRATSLFDLVIRMWQHWLNGNPSWVSDGTPNLAKVQSPIVRLSNSFSRQPNVAKRKSNCDSIQYF